MNINDINLNDLHLAHIYINDDPIYQNGEPIVAGYVGIYVDPHNHSFFRYITLARQVIDIPEYANPLPRYIPPPRVYEDAELPADRMDSPRPQHQHSPRSSRRIARRAVRRALRVNPDNIFLNALPDNPRNIFLSQDPIQRMPRPASPVRQQAPDPNSRRSLRKESKRRRDEKAARIASGWIYGGAKTQTKRRRRH